MWKKLVAIFYVCQSLLLGTNVQYLMINLEIKPRSYYPENHDQKLYMCTTAEAAHSSSSHLVYMTNLILVHVRLSYLNAVGINCIMKAIAKNRNEYGALLMLIVNKILRTHRPVSNTVYNDTFEGENFHGLLLTVNVKFSVKFFYLKSSWNIVLPSFSYMIPTWNIATIATQ